MTTTTTPTKFVSEEKVAPIAVDARGVVGRVFPGCFALRSWRSMDSSGKCPAGFFLGARKVWRLSDLKLWAAWEFCDRTEFQARLTAESNGKTP